MALAGSAINLLIRNNWNRWALMHFQPAVSKAGTVIARFLAAATGIFVFTFLQGVLRQITAEEVARICAKACEKLSDQTTLL